MSDHLPECPAGYVADLCTTDIDPVLQEPTCNHCVGQGCICICNRLRACEQRVLDAAREAVARLQHKPGASIANAVSAIDGLVRDYLASSQQNAYNNPQGADDGER